MPAIIPGTYRISNYGLFFHNLQAFDKRGRSLPVEKADTNSWKIRKADRPARITYRVDDIFDTEQENDIYNMSGTNIDAEQNFVINTPGFFDYLEGMKDMPFKVHWWINNILWNSERPGITIEENLLESSAN